MFMHDSILKMRFVEVFINANSDNDNHYKF